MSNKDIVKNENNVTLYENDRPDFLGDSVRGQEGVTANDIAIPRIILMQDLSPQIKKKNAEYVGGAEAGMLMNNVTEDLYDSIFFIPVFFRKEWVIWKDRDSGGGFRGAYSSELEAAKAMAKLEDAALCTIKDTANHFGLLVKEKTTIDVPVVEEVVVSMSGGTMGSSRKLNSMVRIAGGDRFSRVYRMGSTTVHGAKGDYYSFKFEPLGYVSQILFKMGEVLYDAVKAGEKDIVREDAPKNDDDMMDKTDF